MGNNERHDRIIIGAQAFVLLALVWVGWQVHGLREARPSGPSPSGTVLEWTIRRPEREPVKITLDLHVGETREQWEVRLREALERAEDIR